MNRNLFFIIVILIISFVVITMNGCGTTSVTYSDERGRSATLSFTPK